MHSLLKCKLATSAGFVSTIYLHDVLLSGKLRTLNNFLIDICNLSGISFLIGLIHSAFREHVISQSKWLFNIYAFYPHTNSKIHTK